MTIIHIYWHSPQTYYTLNTNNDTFSGKSEYTYSCNTCKEVCSGDDKNISKEILLNKQVISNVLV